MPTPLRLSLGEDVASVAARAGLPLAAPDAKIREIALVAIDTPTVVAFVSGDDELVLPEAGLVTLDATAAHLVGANLTFGQEPLDREAAFGIAWEVIGTIGAAGLRRAEDGVTRPEALQIALQDAAGADDHMAVLGHWLTEDDDRLLLKVTRAARAGSRVAGAMLAEDLFLVELDISNDRLEDEFEDVLEACRRADHLPADGIREVVLTDYLARLTALNLI